MGRRTPSREPFVAVDVVRWSTSPRPRIQSLGVRVSARSSDEKDSRGRERRGALGCRAYVQGGRARFLSCEVDAKGVRGGTGSWWSALGRRSQVRMLPLLSPNRPSIRHKERPGDPGLCRFQGSCQNHVKRPQADGTPRAGRSERPPRASMPGRMCTCCLSVNTGDSCPRRSWTTFTGTPASSARLAWVWAKMVEPDPPQADVGLAGAQTEQEIAGQGGLLGQLRKRLVKRATEVELTDHLGYEPHQEPPGGAGNTRTGSTPKRLITDNGEVQINTPAIAPGALTRRSSKSASGGSKGSTTRPWRSTPAC